MCSQCTGLRNVVLTGHVGPHKRYTKGSEKERLVTATMAIRNGAVHVSGTFRELLDGSCLIRVIVCLK